MRGIAYSPYRDCQSPGGARLPAGDEIDEDMFRIAHTANAIRTYSATGANMRIAEAAAAHGRILYAGAWLDENGADATELHALLELARTVHPAGLIVGNEFYLRHRAEGRAAASYLLERIRSIKAALPAQRPLVMTAEVDGIMFRWACRNGALVVEGIAPDYRAILDATDAVLVHIYPFWEGQPILGAAALAAARYIAIRDFVSRQYPGKRVIIGETGWPSAGAPVGAAVPGLDAQRRYMAEFMQLAEAHAIDYFYFDAFDEAWKVAEPGYVGQHWGYADATRAVKYDISGLLLPSELIASKVAPPASDLGAVCGRRSGAATVTQTSPAAGEPSGERTCKAGPIYSDWLSDATKFAPVGWLGDTRKVDLFECDRSAPHGGEMAIRAAFAPDGPRGWAGVVWQDPASERGARAGGCDLRNINQVSFWVKGARGGEVVEFQVGGVGAADAAYPDTIRPARSSGPVVLTAGWQPVTIGLAGADRRRVIGAFSWIASRCNNPQPISFFLDDIRLDAAPLPPKAQVLARRPFYVYDDADSGCEHYVPSGFMGDTGDLSLDPRSTEMPFQGRTALRVTYRRSARPARRWAGVYWQAPENNWGTVDGGFDLSWATTLTFRARGRRGGETVEFFAAGLGTTNDRYHDSAPKRTTGLLHMSTSWQRYAIDLRGVDLSRIAGGFGLAVSLSNNPEGAEFFLDEIAYEQ
ncbi:MAG TPA: glycosyl hydrolase family 17 protein [Kofleriaceae bacterium]|nr:glycosyl hydrolase family 17 protein [Kofleriaceae bacterium]